MVFDRLIVADVGQLIGVKIRDKRKKVNFFLFQIVVKLFNKVLLVFIKLFER